MSVMNPNTGRMIRINGPTWNKLQTKKGWSKLSPNKSQRREMLDMCGDKCFLLPREKKFPICAKGTCTVNCRGISAAKIRASQYKYNLVVDKANRLQRKLC